MDSDIQNLDPLLHLLTALKTEQNVNISEVLSSGNLLSFLPVFSVKDAIQSASAIQSVLQALTIGIQNTITALESRAPTSMHLMETSQSMTGRGLLSLPDEILCAIAEEIQSHSEDVRSHSSVLPFSHTCQKLRRAALSFPALWTTITSEYKASQLEAYLKRSQDLPLNVKVLMLQDPDASDEWRTYVYSKLAFIRRAAQHLHRWRLFGLRIIYYDPLISIFLEMIKSYAGIRSLPALQTLSIYQEASTGIDEVQYLDDDFHFYTSWSMPALRKFTFANFIPRSTPFRTVTSVKGIFRSEEDYHRDPTGILSFLRSNPQVRELKLVLENCDFLDRGSGVVTLENVETLNVSWLSESSNHSSLRYLMRHLSFPNVSTLEASLHQTVKWSDIDEWLTSLFAGQERFEKVTNFNMKITLLRLEGCNAIYIFPKLPNLEELSVDALDGSHGVRFWDTTPDVQMPPALRLARLRLSGQFQDDTIYNLLQATNVQKLEFTHCPSFIRKDMENRVGNTEIVWKEEGSVFRLV